MPNIKDRKTDIPNDPLVLHVDTIEFEPTVHLERRKLTVDFEISPEQQRLLASAIYARQQSATRGTMRIRFIGRPV